MGRTPAGHSDLLERDEQLAALCGLLDEACHGSGGVAVIEGPAGIGKSSLLDAFAIDARQRRARVLSVRGDDVVMESSFAAVRELLWPVVAPGADRFEGAARLAAPVFELDPASTTDRDHASTVTHGLYWLVADNAEDGPLVLLADDAHWFDGASSRFLLYLARRIEALPVLLVVAMRSGDRATSVPLALELTKLARVVLHLEPLSGEASRQLVRRLLGPRADDELCRSCHAATRGNPFYVRELAKALKADGGHPDVELARRVQAIGIEAISASVLVRLARLGREAESFAQAVSILGSGAQLRTVAALAALDRAQAVTAADELRSADVLSSGAELAFVHPIVNETIVSQLPQARRAALHGEAARMLAAEGANPDRVAAHLLSADPYGEPWVVSALRLAASEALARGAPEAAVSYLRRALSEPPAAEARLEVLTELGRAEAMLPTAHDFTSLRQALALAKDPAQRAEIAFELALALCGVLRNGDAIAVIDEALRSEAELDPELVMRLDQVRIGGGIGDLEASPRLIARAERYFAAAARGEIEDPRMLSALADTAVLAGKPLEVAEPLATAALADERLLHEWIDDGYVTAAITLCECDRVDEAARAIERGMVEAQRRGSAPMLLQLTMIRTETAIRAGDIELAEELSERGLELGRELGADHIGLLWYPIVLLERGRVREALALFDSLELTVAADLFEAVLVGHRGRVRVALGDYVSGVADLLEVDQRARAAGLASHAFVVDGVPNAAFALGALGRIEEARELAARELAEAADFGSPRRHGVALSVCGTLDQGPAGLELLREAVAMLELSPARLEHARALVNLGIGLLERGQRTAARDPLTHGLELAHRCGSVALSERARAALLTAGARPRRPARSGPEALTATERRTVRMAASGLSNREIAQARYVSTKTVESQLASAYSKLGVHSRTELPKALAHSR